MIHRRLSLLVFTLVNIISISGSRGMSYSDSSCNANPKRSALVVGATGATGREVVKDLLERGWDVTAISRRPLDFVDINTKKNLLNVVSDSFSSLQFENGKSFDALFNCLGTTRGAAGSAEAFVHVERDLTIEAVSLAKRLGVKHASVVSAQGANANTWVISDLIHPLLYMRTLGEKEVATINGGFISTTIYQPGMLNRLMHDRLWENVVNDWLGLGLKVNILAHAMIVDAEKKLADIDSGKISVSGSSQPLVEYVTGNPKIELLAGVEEKK